MSSAIGPSLSTPRLLTEDAGPVARSGGTTTAAPSSAAPPALYQTFGADVFPVNALGIRAPQNAEDAAIILAQAALAVDQANSEASNNRIANAAGGVRNRLGTAIAGLIKADELLTTATGLKAKADSDGAAAKKRADVLEDQIDGLSGQITVLDGRIAAAGSDQDAVAALTLEKAALVQQLGAAGEALAGENKVIAEQQAESDRQAAEMARQQAAIVQGTIALMLVFSDLAKMSGGAGGERAREVGRSAGVDQRITESNDILKALQESDVARDAADAALSADRQDEAVSRRALETALGLAAGISAALDVLGQADTLPALNAREAAITSGPRFQLSL